MHAFANAHEHALEHTTPSPPTHTLSQRQRQEIIALKQTLEDKEIELLKQVAANIQIRM